MKKSMMIVTAVLLFTLGSWPEAREERQYANLSYTVWLLENGVAEAASRINTPIPRVFQDSWNHDLVSLDISDGKPHKKIYEKDGLLFALTAEYPDLLTIQVFEKKQEILRFVHKRASTVDYIFYGADGLTYLMEVTFTVGNHPIGLLSPGILKK